MKNLLQALESAGHEPIVLRERAVILPFGGRVIGLCPDGRTNALWVNSELATAGRAQEFFRKPGWLNIGGVRTWVSPEVDIFIKDLSDIWGTYEVPRELDPGAYTASRIGEGAVSLQTRATIHFHRRGEDVPMEMVKTITLRDEPPVELPSDIAFSGCVIESVLTAEHALPEGVHPGIWSLVQVPGGGRIVVPVRNGGKPRTFFGRPAVAVQNGTISCEVPTSASYKFGIPVESCTGSAFYMNTRVSPASLVVSRCEVRRDAASVYTDAPWDSPASTGYAQQVFVDDGKLGGFGELEHHSPALNGGGQKEIRDKSEVWAFQGTADGIAALMNRMLGEKEGAR